MPSIELLPFSNLDGLDTAFAECVRTSIAGAITANQRIELSTSQLAEPGLLLVEISKDIRGAVARAGGETKGGILGARVLADIN